MEGSDSPHLRRYRAATLAASTRPAIQAFGSFRLDPISRTLAANGQNVPLKSRAFDMLELFVACQGQVLSADEIVGHVWRGVAVGDNNLGVQLSSLRRTLAEHGGKGLIVTLPGRGYRFVGQVTEQAHACSQSTGEPQTIGAPQEISQSRDRPRRSHVAGISAITLAIAVAAVGAVAAWRLVSPIDRPPASVSAENFNPPAHSIAILAFANLSNDPGADYLSDGLSEALIDALSRIKQLQVTARTSSFYFKGKPATIKDIARRLDVASVLEGSLRRQGTHLRIDTRLSDARTGYQLWSQSYDRKLDDMLQLQDEIAGQVANALQVQLVDKDFAERNLGGTTNPLAFDAYLRGEQHLRAVGGEEEAALAEFRKATELDPHFALAQSGLAVALALINNASAEYNDAFRQRMAEARRIAERAVELAPELGAPHARLAMVIRWSASDMNAAWQEAKHALALTPGDATVQAEYALTASVVGHNDEAIAAARRAVELDPLRPDSWYALGQTLDCARKFDAALEAIRHGITVLGHPTTSLQAEIGSLLVEDGQPEEARRYCAAMPEWGGGCLLLANQQLGRTAEVDAKLAEMQSHLMETWSYNYSDMYARVNKPDLAMKYLAKAKDLHDPALQFIKCDWNLDPIRSQPGFKEIEQSLHFPPAE